MKSSSLFRRLFYDKDYSSSSSLSSSTLSPNQKILMKKYEMLMLVSSYKKHKINKLFIVILLIIFSVQCITTRTTTNDNDDDEWFTNTGPAYKHRNHHHHHHHNYHLSSSTINHQHNTNHHHKPENIFLNDLFADTDLAENLIPDSGHFTSFSRQKSIEQSVHESPLSSLSPSPLSTSSFEASQHHNHHDLLFRFEWNFTEVNLANNHLFYIRTKYSCSVPRAKLVKVLDYHASPMKQYVPRCTVLHRCDDESGCCEDVTHRCAPSKTQLVELYFHVIRSDMKNNITGGNAVGIERLTFLNHTQCECKPINYMPRSVLGGRPPLRLVSTKPTSTNHQPNHKPPNNEGHHQKCRHVIKCPQPFIQRFRGSDQRCVCDCGGLANHPTKVSYQYCLKVQDGTAKLDTFWSKCIDSKECSEPVCAYGLRYSPIEQSCQVNHHHHRIRHHHHHHLHQPPSATGR